MQLQTIIPQLSFETLPMPLNQNQLKLFALMLW